MSDLNWSWIALSLTGPPALAFLLAWAIWQTKQIILGNVAGTGVIFAAAIAFIFREQAEIEDAVNACLDAGTACFPEPSAFVRFAIYACIGMAQVFALFMLSLRYEMRQRRRDYAPEWR
jgi:hypothetical protein